MVFRKCNDKYYYLGPVRGEFLDGVYYRNKWGDFSSTTDPFDDLIILCPD